MTDAPTFEASIGWFAGETFDVEITVTEWTVEHDPATKVPIVTVDEVHLSDEHVPGSKLPPDVYDQAVAAVRAWLEAKDEENQITSYEARLEYERDRWYNEAEQRWDIGGWNE